MTKKFTTIFYAVLIACLSLTSCSTPVPNRQYIIGKKDDDGWTPLAMIYCDSVDMLSDNHAVYWVDGNDYDIYAKSYIKIATNPQFKTTTP